MPGILTDDDAFDAGHCQRTGGINRQDFRVGMQRAPDRGTFEPSPAKSGSVNPIPARWRWGFVTEKFNKSLMRRKVRAVKIGCV